MKPVRLILIPNQSSAHLPWLITDRQGRILDRGLLDPELGERLEPMPTVALAPGSEVMVRWLDLPPGSPAQLRAAARWALRDSVAAAPDRLVFSVGAAPRDGGPRMVAVASRSLLDAWVAHLAELGASPDVIFPDVLAVTEPEDDSSLNSVLFGEALALRGRRFAAAAQPELAPLLAAGRPITPTEDRDEVERGLIDAALRPPINLLDEIRSAPTPLTSWRRAGVLAALAAISPLVLLLAAAARDEAVSRQIQARTQDLIASREPDLASAADPAAAVRRKAAIALPPGGVSAAAAALFNAVERVEGAELDILIADPGEGVKATLNHPGLEDVKALRADMIRAGYEISVTGTAEESGRVVTDLTIGGL